MVRRRLLRWSARVVLALALTGRWDPAAYPGGAALAAPSEPGGRPRLYVYLHTDAKSAALEEILRARLPGLEVTVFGRFPDFEEAFRHRPPDAILARPMFLTSRHVPIALQGIRGNSDREPHVLVSNSAPLEGSLAGRKIGVLDLLGRSATEEYYSKLLATPDLSLKRVIKREDLLPLLQFGQAEAVLVPAAAAKGLKEQSQMALRTRVLNEAQVGLPAVGLVSAASRDVVVRQFAALDVDTNRLLEVDKWRAP